MLHPLERRVVRTIRQHGLLGHGDRVAIALSGGPDSVALTWVLHEAAPDLQIEIAGLIHVNHQLRGADSDADEAFCRALAERLRLPIEVTRVDVAALARTRRRSIEATAREARYTCFASAADRLGASRVATGHTLDDQAETVLLRLLRGTGTRGLSGIRVRRGPFVRPLLDCRRLDLVRYLTDRREPSRDDASNQDRRIPRNRIRHDLLPVIDRMAPGARRALARLAEQSADDEDFFRELVIGLIPSVVLPEGRVSLEALAGQPPALVRRLIRGELERAAPGLSFNAGHVADVMRLMTSTETSGHLDLPGLVVEKVVERDARALVIRAASAPQTPAPAARFEYSLPCPGAVAVPEAGVTLLASLDAPNPRVDDGRGEVAAVQLAGFEMPLTVRSRRDGDRVRPLGAPGSRKLQDLFVDRKIPRQERDRVPIVTDAGGRIMWVAGVTIAEEGRVRTPGKGVVILTVKKGLQ
jgi:tRNA(Ile)-lysidine synthase